MRIFKQLFTLTLLMLWANVQTAEAQLINYKRRGQQPQNVQEDQKRKPSVSPSANKSAASEKQLPAWMKILPPAKSKEEVRYDVNRDGQLQSAEVKILLRDIVDMVEKKGGVKIESEVLKEYDQDKNGLIDRKEIEHIRNDVNN
jgi:hypothetical protein